MRRVRSGNTELELAACVPLDRVIVELRGFSAADRLLGLYELGIGGCDDEDREQVLTVLTELLATLDPRYGEMADGFRHVYEYCRGQILDGNFMRPAFLLEMLRDTLAAAEADESRAVNS
jgi:hypothetical protein